MKTVSRLPERILRKLLRVGRRVAFEIPERRYAENFESLETGTAPWLIAAERRYGGFVRDVRRHRVSQIDPRGEAALATGGMVGGDRMTRVHHGFAPHYSRHLLPLARSGRRIVLAEAGVLRGSGLAIWCDLFPEGRIIGLDIDFSHIRGNMDNLEALGAFAKNQPELHEFDQFEDNRARLAHILDGDRIDVYIDDGFHSDESILSSLASTWPHLARPFVCIIEDNATVAPKIAEAYADARVEPHGDLTIVIPAGAESLPMS